jgi:hypothetical protein
MPNRVLLRRSKQLRCSTNSFAILRIALLRAAPQYCLRNFLLCVATATADNLLRWYSL